MARRFDRKGYQRDMGRCTGVRKYSNGRIGRCDHPSHGCFTGDMRVLTPTGYARIDSLAQGSPIIAYDVASGSLSESQAKRLIRRAAARTLTVSFVGGRRPLRVTPDHSLRTESGWVKAGALFAGARIQGGQELLTVEAISSNEEEVAVFNLYPYGTKTFIVEGAVAHSFTRFRVVREWLHRVLECIPDALRPQQPAVASG